MYCSLILKVDHLMFFMYITIILSKKRTILIVQSIYPAFKFLDTVMSTIIKFQKHLTLPKFKD